MAAVSPRRGPADRRDRQPGPAQPRDHLRLLAAGGGGRRADRPGRELVHVRDVGVAAGGRDDPRRGHARPARPTGSAAARCCTRCGRSGAGCCGAGSSTPRRGSDGCIGRLHTPFDAVELASDAVARGNRKVFEEIGFEFARWLEADDLRAAFLAGLRDGDPPDGQRYCGRVHPLLSAPVARAAAAVAARQPRDRPARADPAAAGDLRGARRRHDHVRGARPAPVPGPRRPRVQRAARRSLVAPVQGKLGELSRELITHALMVLSVPGASCCSARTSTTRTPRSCACSATRSWRR